MTHEKDQPYCDVCGQVIIEPGMVYGWYTERPPDATPQLWKVAPLCSTECKSAWEALRAVQRA